MHNIKISVKWPYFYFKVPLKRFWHFFPFLPGFVVVFLEINFFSLKSFVIVIIIIFYKNTALHVVCWKKLQSNLLTRFLSDKVLALFHLCPSILLRSGKIGYKGLLIRISCFEDQELSVAKLKFLFLKMLYEWTLPLVSFLVEGLLDFMDSYLFVH